MLSRDSVEHIIRVAKKYGAARVILFGSCLRLPEAHAGDIDLAVEGLAPGQFMEMWNDLTWSEELGMKNVDLIRAEDCLPVMVIARAEGVVIFERDRAAVSA
ncbi:MAG: nucleotidyltransferase family protein [Aminivibrio sp.]|jgi:predicted nucleotidyltransferase|nr:nucleotidyltransferase domain-containing protein [Synergistaceae bacterium]